MDQDASRATHIISPRAAIARLVEGEGGRFERLRLVPERWREWLRGLRACVTTVNTAMVAEKPANQCHAHAWYCR
eukprot:2145863-Rhodomonas_salina.5